jgi:hypothetical protein
MSKRQNRRTEAEARILGSALINEVLVELGFAKTTTIRPLADSPLFPAGLRLAHALRSRESGDLVFHVTAGRETNDHWALIRQIDYPSADGKPRYLPGAARPWGDRLAADRPDLELVALLAPPAWPPGTGRERS